MKKKIVLAATALTLCGVIAVGGTLAYLSAETNTLTNEFAYDYTDKEENEQRIIVDIGEPKWGEEDEYQFATTDPNDPDQKKPTDANFEYGSKKPLIPDSSANKNPLVRLKTTTSAYIGMTVTLTDNGGVKTWAEFDENFTIKNEETYGNNSATHQYATSWIEANTIGNTRYFIYVGNGKDNATAMLTTPLQGTDPLFQFVAMKGKVTDDQIIAWLGLVPDATGKVSGTGKLFDLEIKGWAAQATVETDPDLWTPQVAITTTFPEFLATPAPNPVP